MTIKNWWLFHPIRCRLILTLLALCAIFLLSLATITKSDDDTYVTCASLSDEAAIDQKPLIDDTVESINIFQDSEGGTMAVHNFYIDDRDSPAILRGFAVSRSSESNSDHITPSTIYSLVWFASDEPPASTACRLRDHRLPLPQLDQDFTHVIECTLRRDGGIVPNYVSITHELCGDPLTFLPINAFEQMDQGLVDFFHRWSHWCLIKTGCRIWGLIEKRFENVMFDRIAEWFAWFTLWCYV